MSENEESWFNVNRCCHAVIPLVLCKDQIFLVKFFFVVLQPRVGLGFLSYLSSLCPVYCHIFSVSDSNLCKSCSTLSIQQDLPALFLSGILNTSFFIILDLSILCTWPNQQMQSTFTVFDNMWLLKFLVS